MVPNPFNVATLGMGIFSINSRNCGTAFAMPTPPPTYKIGFLACLIRAIAALVSAGSNESANLFLVNTSNVLVTCAI